MLRLHSGKKNRLLTINFRCFLVLLLLITQNSWADIAITDQFGEHRFKDTPLRVISLSWELTEQLIELNAPLLGSADTQGYRQWVVKPALPSGVEDLGTRAEPNLEKIARLQPDLILINGLQNHLRANLQQIAPVLSFQGFSKEHNNPQAAIQIFRKLALLFSKTQLAEQKLATMQKLFSTLNKQLRLAYPGGLPKVSSVRFANTSSVYIYGDNSMSQYALAQLGIKPALVIKKTQWGLVQKRVLDLSKIQQGAVLFFEPFPAWKQLQQSRLWQAMPVVRNKQVAAISSTWTYGGAMSIMYLAQAMTDSLLSMANAPIRKSELAP
jgi:iron complex transport system substrate-binding protein